jgi:hypothetical protein
MTSVFYFFKTSLFDEDIIKKDVDLDRKGYTKDFQKVMEKMKINKVENSLNSSEIMRRLNCYNFLQRIEG